MKPAHIRPKFSYFTDNILYTTYSKQPLLPGLHQGIGYKHDSLIYPVIRQVPRVHNGTSPSEHIFMYVEFRVAEHTDSFIKSCNGHDN